MSEVCKEQVYRKIFFERSKALRNFIYYRCGNLQQAEDLVQESFAKLWENCKNIPVEKAKSYLYTVANNAMLNQIAHQKVVLKFQTVKQNKLDIEDPQYVLEHDEFKTKIANAISDLPENQRVVFMMNRFDGKTYRVIAEELGISVKAVEKRMHKALSILKKIHHKM